MSDPANRSQEHFMRLFIESERELLRYIMAAIPSPNDARDVLQETAAALWKKMDAYDPAMPFTPWACRFAANEIRAFLRREQRQRRWLDEDVAELLRVHQEQCLETSAAEAEALRSCLDQMPPRQRDLLRGYYFEEQGIDTLSHATGQTAEALYKMLQRARQTLAECVRRHTEVPA